MKSRRISRDISQRLLERMLQADRPPLELARELGVSPAQLASWSDEPASGWILQRLARLADVRAQMLLSNFRANAAIQLIQIAAATEPTELSRKACVDLLTANLKVFSEDDQHAEPDHSVGPKAPTEEMILRALEKLGDEDQPASAM